MTAGSCPRPRDQAHAVDVVLAWPELDAADRCRLLDGIKRGLCDCYEVCDYGIDRLIAENS